MTKPQSMPIPLLSESAKHDIHAALVHTQREWGRDQRAMYMQTLRSDIQFIGGNPEAGTPHDDLYPGLRAHPSGRHMIYWIVEDGRTIVVRVLHMQQDLETINWNRSRSRR